MYRIVNTGGLVLADNGSDHLNWYYSSSYTAKKRPVLVEDMDEALGKLAKWWGQSLAAQDRKLAYIEDARLEAHEEPCGSCGGAGGVIHGYVTRDMALDAGDEGLEGQPVMCDCPDCGGTGAVEEE